MGGDKRFHTFPNSICPKADTIPLLGFELTNYDVAVQHISHYPIGLMTLISNGFCPVSWGCRIHQLLFCRKVRHLNKCPGYDTKQTDSEVPVMLGLWGMRSNHSLPSLQGPLWPGVVATDKVLSLGQIELNSVIMLKRIVFHI